MALHIVILAAGQGKRMFSDLPKVLHPIGGKPMLKHVLDTAFQLEPEVIHVIHGHGGDIIQQAMGKVPVNWIEQTIQAGTGHALLQAMPSIPAEKQVLVLYGDVPLIEVATLKALLETAGSPQHSALSLLVADMPDPTGFGRIIRNSGGDILQIVEEKDANPQQKAITEIYTGICCTSSDYLKRWLPALSNDNMQKEYLLTDIIAMAVEKNCPLRSIKCPDNMQIQGVNTRLQQEELERCYQRTQGKKLLLSGISIADINRLDIRGELICGKDVYIDINCIFEGKVVLGEGCRIGSHCVLTDVSVGEGTEILSHSMLAECVLGKDCSVGPFARIRPGTRLDDHCKVGNFVEIKNAQFGKNTKASHLSYLGDATLGEDVNIGAGTITCNYDGANKHHTLIGDNVHVGSDTQLIAPITVGANATIGAGSTLRKDVPEGGLTLTVSEQRSIASWKRPGKKNK